MRYMSKLAVASDMDRTLSGAVCHYCLVFAVLAVDS